MSFLWRQEAHAHFRALFLESARFDVSWRRFATLLDDLQHFLREFVLDVLKALTLSSVLQDRKRELSEEDSAKVYLLLQPLFIFLESLELCYSLY